MIDHSNRPHYTYGASGAHRWQLCHASTFASQGIADEQSIYALDGTEAHEVLDFSLEIEERSAADAQALWPPSKVISEPEQYTDRANAVQVALDYVYGLLDKFPDAVLVREKQYPFSNDVTNDAGGTVDVGVYVPSMNWLYVPDYKHGVGNVVDIDDNAQTYMYGHELVFGPDAPFPEAEFITLAIIQPRAFGIPPVREVTVTRDVLWAFGLEATRAIRANMDVEMAAIAGLDISASYNPGEKQCKWCKARYKCKARDAWYASKAGNDFKSVVQLIDLIPEVPAHSKPKTEVINLVNAETPEETARKLPMYEQIYAFLGDYIEAAEHRVRNGQKIPGYKLVEVQSRARWLAALEPVEIATRIIELTGADWDIVFPRKLATITDMKALLKAVYIDTGLNATLAAKQADEALATVIDKSSSGNLTVVPESDRRPAVTNMDPDKAFASVKLIS